MRVYNPYVIGVYSKWRTTLMAQIQLPKNIIKMFDPELRFPIILLPKYLYP